MQPHVGVTVVERVMTLLIESGLIYILIWVCCYCVCMENCYLMNFKGVSLMTVLPIQANGSTTIFLFMDIWSAIVDQAMVSAIS
jgi:hypothetical protein